MVCGDGEFLKLSPLGDFLDLTELKTCRYTMLILLWISIKCDLGEMINTHLRGLNHSCGNLLVKSSNGKFSSRQMRITNGKIRFSTTLQLALLTLKWPLVLSENLDWSEGNKEIILITIIKIWSKTVLEMQKCSSKMCRHGCKTRKKSMHSCSRNGYAL